MVFKQTLTHTMFLLESIRREKTTAKDDLIETKAINWFRFSKGKK